jgi:hypothetical protein
MYDYVLPALKFRLLQRVGFLATAVSQCQRPANRRIAPAHLIHESNSAMRRLSFRATSVSCQWDAVHRRLVDSRASRGNDWPLERLFCESS